MAKSRVSLKDLAKELQVSISTVSRALVNHPDISEELTIRIQALAKEMNYRPNPYALNLLKNESKTIGVIVPDIVTHFYASIISGIERFAEENGYSIVISSSQESYQKEINNINNLLNLRVDGLVICLSQETTDYKHFDKIIEENTPLVFVDRVCRTNEVSSVVADNFEAARLAVHHFYENGLRNIAFINGPGHLNISKQRLTGYIEGLKECKLKISNNLLASCDLSVESTIKATHKLLETKLPDAILSINDSVAFTVMKELKRHGYKIPDDIAMIGFTDEFHATLVEPELTSIMHPTFDMGQEAAKIIVDQLTKKQSNQPKQVIMKTELVIRKSSIKSY